MTILLTELGLGDMGQRELNMVGKKANKLSFPPSFYEFVSQHKFQVCKDGIELIASREVLQGWEHYTQETKDVQFREITARDRTIIDLYMLVIKLLPDFQSAELDVETVSKLNSIYKCVEDFNLQDEIDKKLLEQVGKL